MVKSLLSHFYRDSLALLTDLYELTMAYAYWKNGWQKRKGAFQLFFRTYPFGSSFAIVAGVETALEYIENFHLSEEDYVYLARLKNSAGGVLFEKDFLDFLKEMKLDVDVKGMKEGSLVFPIQPIIRVEGPIIAAQLLEPALLNIINFQTLIATKSARICFAADGDPVIEFGIRRAQGIDGALSASRAAYIGGCTFTSHVLAGKYFDIPVMGTHAHSWVMAYEKEEEAFKAFARAMPYNCVFLIDTYDSLRGADRAIEVALSLKKEGIVLKAVRLDSGDLYSLSTLVRKKLDRAGLVDTEIMATNELSEQRIALLKQQGAPISLWGVGTHLVTGKDQPALDGVYKLVAVSDANGKWKPRMKVSDEEVKMTLPGRLQVRRYEKEGTFLGDLIYEEELGPSNPKSANDESGKDLLETLIEKGVRICSRNPLKKARAFAQKSLKSLPSGSRDLNSPTLYPCQIDEALEKKRKEMAQRFQKR